MRRVLIPLAALAASCSPAGRVQELPEPTRRIIDAALEESQAYEKLCYLCDRIGHRLSGSENLNRAIEWAVRQMREDGLSNVRTQPCKVPVWVRGEESAEILEPSPRPMFMLGLGDSVATPPEGITAEVVCVKSFEELGPHVKDKIVLYNVPFTTYGETVRFRTGGATEAAHHGAAAALVRSVGPVSLRTPHTGNQTYGRAAPPIPAAAVSIEDAETIQRLRDRGVPVKVRLRMGARKLPDADSANVIGEIPGRTDEIVLIGGHLDSWDVGSGAHDDGAGCVIVMEAARILVKLGLKPMRTIRVVLFTNEENGGAGAKAYREAMGDEVGRHAAAIEADSGGDRPLGFGLTIQDQARHARGLACLREISRFLKPLGADAVRESGGGADIRDLASLGVPIMSLNPDTSRYFHYHHTHSDTPDKVDPRHLAMNAAAMAVMAWHLAEMDGRLGD